MDDLKTIPVPIPRQDALATVEGSPKAVAAHDKDAWVGLFAEFSVIEDPVGSRPNLSGIFDARSGRRGDAAHRRFYDTFIAPNKIEFHVERDVVCGTHVVRDLDIEITMAPTVVVRTPMHLVYELCEESGELRIRRLNAHWEMLPMVGRLMAQGPSAWAIVAALWRRQLANLGVSGTAGFAAGMRSVGKAGKRVVADLAGAVRRGDAAAAAALFADGATGIEAPYGHPPLSPRRFVDEGAVRFTPTKTLASGATVSASLEIETDTGTHGGVGFFELDRASRLIDRVRLYWEP
ncbi:MAG: nuclear transport factor 2 family protein [Acidimicrobiia bacterium]|nr:nuclear transport factor 2 family protein [Acidimicrobiia bacterium]